MADLNNKISAAVIAFIGAHGGRLQRLRGHANNSAPAGVNFTNVPALVQPQPAVLDGQLQAGAVFGRRAVLPIQERSVDPFVDAPVLYRLDSLAISMILRAAALDLLFGLVRKYPVLGV